MLHFSFFRAAFIAFFGKEVSGKDYVIRPPIPLEIGAMERDPAQLRRVYETGRAVAENQIDKIEAFLNDVKETPEE